MTDWVIAAGFEPVAAEFERNFGERGDLGAAFAAVVAGETVVDLWGGIADRARQQPWERDTLQLIFSGAKGLVAICLLILIDRGKLDLETPVCEYWPEFAAAGKQGLTVRQVVTHSAGLPGLAEPVRIEDLTDDRRMAELLAAQPQFTDPRALRTYHPLTYGWLYGELVRRIDGRSIGRFFAEEIAAPLELELFIGLPEQFEPRVSRLELADDWKAVFTVDELSANELTRAIMMNPPFFITASFPWNSRAYHQAEIPGAGAIGTARSIAKLYAALEQLVSPAALALGTSELERRVDGLSESPEDVAQSYGVGFALQDERGELGPPADAFGHPGAGGSIHGRWPALETGFSYSMNLMRYDSPNLDPRSKALLDALHGCVTA